MSIIETFSNSIASAPINKCDKITAMYTPRILWPTYHVGCGKSSETGLLDIYLTTFSESVISEIENLSGSSFFSKFSKIFLDFKNVEKDSGKVFCFRDNSI